MLNYLVHMHVVSCRLMDNKRMHMQKMIATHLSSTVPSRPPQQNVAYMHSMLQKTIVANQSISRGYKGGWSTHCDALRWGQIFTATTSAVWVDVTPCSETLLFR